MKANKSSERSVYEVAIDLESLTAGTNLKPYQFAQKKIVECNAAGDRDGARFWRNVWIDAILIAQGQRDVQVFRDD